MVAFRSRTGPHGDILQTNNVSCIAYFKDFYSQTAKLATRLLLEIHSTFVVFLQGMNDLSRKIFAQSGPIRAVVTVGIIAPDESELPRELCLSMGMLPGAERNTCRTEPTLVEIEPNESRQRTRSRMPHP